MQIGPKGRCLRKTVKIRNAQQAGVAWKLSSEGGDVPGAVHRMAVNIYYEHRLMETGGGSCLPAFKSELGNH